MSFIVLFSGSETTCYILNTVLVVPDVVIRATVMFLILALCDAHTRDTHTVIEVSKLLLLLLLFLFFFLGRTEFRSIFYA